MGDHLWGYWVFTWRASSGPPGWRKTGTITGLRARTGAAGACQGAQTRWSGIQRGMAHGLGWPRYRWSCSPVLLGTRRWETECSSRRRCGVPCDGHPAGLGAESAFRGSAGQHSCGALGYSWQACGGDWPVAGSAHCIHHPTLQGSAVCWHGPPVPAC